MINKNTSFLYLLASLYIAHYAYGMDGGFQDNNYRRSSLMLYGEEHPVISIKKLKESFSTSDRTYEKNQETINKALTLLKKYLPSQDEIVIQELCGLVCELLKELSYHYAPLLESMVQEIEAHTHIPEEKMNAIVLAFADFNSKHLEQYEQRVANMAQTTCTLI